MATKSRFWREVKVRYWPDRPWRELGAALGLSEMCFNRRRARPPSLKTVLDLARVLDAPFEDLLELKEEGG